jgi:diguanylate cyclase (GGDEF)-like protein/PAS domain S-box-containing protein
MPNHASSKLVNHTITKLTIAKCFVVFAAYLVTAKLGLLVPYKQSIATLLWLPSGIAAGAIFRWGKLALPAIFLAAAITEYSVGVSVPASLAIAFTNTLAPLVVALALQKLKFNSSLVRQKDIALLIGAALFGMLISSSGGAIIVYLSGLVSLEDIDRVWFIWWVGDSVGVLLAMPLALNIRNTLPRLKTSQYYQLICWLVFFTACELIIANLVTSVNRQFMLSLFLIMPVLIWSSMHFGIIGGSLVVIILTSIAVWATSQGYGAFYSANADEGLFSLWAFVVTLVVMMLLISVLQSERNLAERALRTNERKLRSVIEGALDGIITIDASGAIVEFNPSAERIFGYKKSEVLGRPLSEVIVPPNYRKAHIESHQAFVNTGIKHIFGQRVELMGMHADGKEFPVELTLTTMKENNATLVTGFLRDISQQKQARQEIENIAYFDVLTGLPNRRLLIDRFQRAVVNAKRDKNYCALIFVDLDHFKSLNDSKGHDVGDQLLVEVAKRIQQSIRAGDTVARLSGDEFILIIENLSPYQRVAFEQIADIMQKLLTELNKSYQLGMYEFNTTASIGITLFNDDQFTFEDHLRHADTAMYQSKTAGRNTYHFYDQQTQQNLEKDLAVEMALQSALKNREFSLHYQKIVDAQQQVVAAEVLLRWTHPVLGEISPAEFIPIAENNNLIIKIGYWVLQQACAQIKAWEADPVLSKIRLSVNISAKQFLYVNFIKELKIILSDTGIDPDKLKLELTETAVIDNIEDVIQKFKVLRGLGVRISLDDFGMGHSSLVYLKKLPVTQIKIDQSFVHDIVTDSNDAAIIQMILAIGRTIQCNIVAEGVENIEQFELLRHFGCEYYQGFYFSKPVTPAAFEKSVIASSSMTGLN